MRINRLSVLAAIAVTEGILLILIFASGYRSVHIFVKRNAPVLNPLALALEYESPDRKFEELVKQYPSWMRYRAPLGDNESGMSILTRCAIVKNTNYVRILIAHGADVEETATELNRVGANDAIALLCQTQSELKNQTETTLGNTNSAN